MGSTTSFHSDKILQNGDMSSAITDGVVSFPGEGLMVFISFVLADRYKCSCALEGYLDLL